MSSPFYFACKVLSEYSKLVRNEQIIPDGRYQDAGDRNVNSDFISMPGGKRVEQSTLHSHL
jgi:hypothetical protein